MPYAVSFASYHDAAFMSFGCLRVLNEDRVAPSTGFPTHPHRDAEIFSYILSGELTHRDSMIQEGSENDANGGMRKQNDFYRMHRGDVQFTTGGKGIAHSEQNEDKKSPVHFLQIWALPWARGLTPRYHTKTFGEAAKRLGFVHILSPLKAGLNASPKDEEEAAPTIPDTIPIHADMLMGAALIGSERTFQWLVGCDATGNSAVSSKQGRRVYVHLPMTKDGNARIKLDGRDAAILDEGDGAFITNVNAGDKLNLSSIGNAEAEVIVLDSN